MPKIKIQDFLLILDHQNNIQSIYPSDSIFSNYVNLKIDKIVTDGSLNHLHIFLSKLNHENASFHYPISLKHLEQTYACHMNGYKDELNIYIFVLFNTTSEEEVFIKILQLNSQQVNEIRKIRKDYQSQDSKIYEEISKLNSELLNSKRIIEKQNSELQRYNNLLQKMAIEDSLTGSYNRRYFNEYMNEYILPSQKDVFHCLIMIDFNDFKLVNDQFGHDAGDRLLIMFVNMTKNIIAGKGHIFRIGGDEFMIVLNKMRQEEAQSYINTIKDDFLKISKIASISYGLIEFNESAISHDFDLSSLINKVDQYMYAYKKRNKI